MQTKMAKLIEEKYMGEYLNFDFGGMGETSGKVVGVHGDFIELEEGIEGKQRRWYANICHAREITPANED